MADFLESVLSSEEPPAMEEPIAPEIQQPAEPAPAEQPAPLAPEPPQEPAPVEPAAPQQGFVPIAAMLDERDRRKALEAQIAHYQAQPQQVQQAPDPLDDPEGFQAYLNGHLTQALTQQRFDMSSEMARQTHGEAVVTAAADWAAQRAASDPVFRASWQQTLQNNSHPLNWVVQQHKRDALLSEAGDVSSLEDLVKAHAERFGYVSQSASVAAAPVMPIAAVQPAPRPVAPPRSIASEAPVSAPEVIDSKAAFEAIFNQR